MRKEKSGTLFSWVKNRVVFDFLISCILYILQIVKRYQITGDAFRITGPPCYYPKAI